MTGLCLGLGTLVTVHRAVLTSRVPEAAHIRPLPLAQPNVQVGGVVVQCQFAGVPTCRDPVATSFVSSGGSCAPMFSWRQFGARRPPPQKPGGFQVGPDFLRDGPHETGSRHPAPRSGSGPLTAIVVTLGSRPGYWSAAAGNGTP